MLKFQINKYVELLSNPELPLNDDWTVRWDWKTTGGIYLSFCIKSNKIINYEEILVSGELTVSKPGGQKAKLGFTKFMTSSQPMQLGQLLVCEKASDFVTSAKYYLLGNIIIASKCDKCACILQSVDNEKCMQPKSLVQLSNDFERLLDPQTSTLADVKLICGSVSIPAHKTILSARSPVFATMFQNPMKESHENQVNIDDIDTTVFQTVMMYIYTGKTSKLTISSASDLLLAADKYQLQDLKEVCCDFLKKNVTLENALGITVLGDLLAEDLKSFAVEYIYKNCEDFAAFEKTEEWRKLMTDKPNLAMNILASILKCRDKK